MAGRPLMARVSASHLAIIGAGAAAVLALGTWIYIDVQRELKTLAAANLRSLLDTQVGALDTWIREKQLNVDRWAKDARVIAAASATTGLVASGAPTRPSRLARVAARSATRWSMRSTRSGKATLPKASIWSIDQAAYWLHARASPLRLDDHAGAAAAIEAGIRRPIDVRATDE